MGDAEAVSANYYFNFTACESGGLIGKPMKGGHLFQIRVHFQVKTSVRINLSLFSIVYLGLVYI